MDEVEQLHCKAIGYVWGMEDSSNETVRSIRRLFSEAYETWDISFLFSQAYAEHVKTGSWMDIRSAWESWATYGLIFFGYWELKSEARND